MAIGLHVFFKGKVQGVGFRFAVRRFARELSINGWIRNLEDGRVEMYAEGETEAMGSLLTMLDEKFEIEEKDVSEDPQHLSDPGFVIRH